MTRLKAKSKVKSTEIARRTTRSVTAKLYQSCLKIPKVPDDIFQSILDILKADGDFKTLTSVARTNHSMYDMIIPMLYGVVTFNRGNCAGKNRKMIGYGHESQHDLEELTRKDIAASFTRKIILDEIPDLPISHSYRALAELVIEKPSPWSYEPYHSTSDERTLWTKSRFKKCLEAVAPSLSAIESLHVKLRFSYKFKCDYDRILVLFQCFESAIPCTYEIATIDWEDAMTFYTTYDLQCVVHFWGSWGISPDRKALYIASHINECFDEEDLDAPTGQLFICDLPPLVLTPQELASAIEPDEAAINKICDLVSVYPDLTGSIYKTKLDFFKSRIKLVKSGFKPSLADLYPRPQPKRGLSAVMLPDDFIFVPDDEWSLTDDEPMDSEAEYSGSETSGFDTDSDSEMDQGER